MKPLAGLIYDWKGEQFIFIRGAWYLLDAGAFTLQNPPDEALISWGLKENAN